MASGLGVQDAGLERRKTASDPDEGSDESALRSRLSRKRTKTGCLTCRKRRIKCGEERPICKNCVKSRRHCEGYNQRVVFKQPAFDYRPVPNGAHIVFNSRPVAGSSEPLPPGFEHAPIDPTYAQMGPRPLEQYAPGYHEAGQPHFAVDLTGRVHPQDANMPFQFSPGSIAAPNAFQQSAFLPTQVPFDAVSRATGTPMMHASYPPQGPFLPTHGESASRPMFLNTQWGQSDPAMRDQSWSAAPALSRGASPNSSRPSQAYAMGHNSAPPTSAPPWHSANWIARPELSHPIDYRPTTTAHQTIHEGQFRSVPQTSEVMPQDPYSAQNFQMNVNSATDFLREAAVETQDDDYYDLHPEEETDADMLGISSDNSKPRQILGKILEINNLTLSEGRTRRTDSFNISRGVLERYRVEEVANPLRNPATARLFAHFISVTGPALSVFERQSLHSAPSSTNHQTPSPSQQSLWTYDMPMAALRHQGLLHAMLALASLHIARLHGASGTPSMQHYAWALKRIHKSVGKQSQNRLKLTTIAASMLLGYYEIVAADHMKWNTHLAGSKQLFLETDFVGMMQKFKQMKAERATRQQMASMQNVAAPPQDPQEQLLDSIPEVDEHLISQLAGREVRYGTPGFVATRNPDIPPQLDLRQFELLKDLYWWFLKQDAYQSFISGNPLLLDFKLWANCTPRGPLGQPDAAYGSFDHLVLLMGRVAEFASQDRKRKLKVMEANGGQWKPAPGMNISRPPVKSPLRTPTSEQPPKPIQGPSFYGMAPPPQGSMSMPASYSAGSSATTPQASAVPEPFDLRTATQQALEEYGRLRAALHIFAQSLGEGFEPFSSELQPQTDTPFGKALFYRSYPIACIWTMYYMCVIIAIRSHPHMHPAAHVSAGLAAQETSFFANEIGRISAGMVALPHEQPLNPTTAAALSESCIPSFFAAVQYQNPAQRHSTVSRIANIGVRTGWGSAEVIANGCETAWVRAAEAGRGPPYRRTMRREVSDDPRVSGVSEGLHPLALVDEKDETDETDRRLVTHSANARLNWAIGVMGMEYDETVAM